MVADPTKIAAKTRAFVPRLLVVDDDEDVLQTIEDILVDAGYTVVTADCGETAIKKLREEKFDLTLIDINLPDTNGDDLFHEMKKIQGDLECMLMSGRATLDNAVKAVGEPGIVAFETKPFDWKRLMIIINEVTERKYVERKLKKSEIQFSTLVTSIADMVFFLDKEGFVKYCNPAVEQHFDMSAEELIGIPLEFFWCGESIISIQDAIKEVKKFKDVEFLDSSCMDRRYHLAITPMIESDELTGIVCTARDVTARRVMEEKLDFERQQLLSIFDSIGHIIYVADPETYEVLYVNSYLRKIHEKNPVGKLCYKVFQGLDAPCEFCTNDKILENKDEVLSWEHHNKSIDRYYMLFDRIIKWPDGRDVRFELAIDTTDQKKAEQERDRLFDNSIDMMAIAGNDGYFKQLNKSWTKTLGWTAEELMSRPYKKFIHPGDIEKTTAIEKVLRRGEAVNSFENRYVCKDGSYRYLSWNTFPLLDEGLLFCVTRDVTEQKKSIEELESSERKFNVAFHNSPDAMVISLLSSRKYLDVNKVMERITGLSREELIGKSPMDIGIVDDPERGKEAFETVEREGLLQNFEFDMRTKSGGIRHCLVSSQVIEIDGKKCALSSIRDITRQKKLTEEKMQSEAYKSAILNSTYDFIQLVNSNHEIVDLNDAEANRRGEKRDSLIGTSVFDDPLGSARAIEFKRVALDNVFQTGKPSRYIDRDAYPEVYDINIYPVLNEQGETTAAAIYTRDITEFERAVNALEKREDELRELYQRLVSAQEEERKSIARELHDELGQKLAGLKMEITALKLAPDRMENFLEVSRGILEEISKTLTGIYNGLRPTVIDKLGLELAIGALIRDQYERSGLKINFFFDNAVESCIDEDMSISIYRIIQESMTNVVKYAKATKISISIAIKNNDIIIKASDDGIGIDHTMLDKKISFGIMGMKERARQHGGVFSIESGVDGGTLITVKIPATRKRSIRINDLDSDN